MKTLFFVILAILQVATVLIPSFGKLYIENEETNDFKPTRIGLFLIVTTMLSFAVTLGLFFIIENEESKHNTIQAELQRTRDSTITEGINKGVDSSRSRLFKDLSEALAKQNLRFDTFTNTLNKISDSTGKTINNYAQTDPILTIESGGFRLIEEVGNVYSYNYDITSLGAASANFNIYLHLILIPKAGPNKYIGKIKSLTTEIQIPSNGKINNLSANLNNPEAFIGFYVYLQGTYTSADGQKAYPCDQLYQFFPSTNKISLVTDESQRKLVIESIPR